jgi:hypothetical protein
VEKSSPLLLCSVCFACNDQVKEIEMGRACSTNGPEEECVYDTEGKARRKETTACIADVTSTKQADL